MKILIIISLKLFIQPQYWNASPNTILIKIINQVTPLSKIENTFQYQTQRRLTQLRTGKSSLLLNNYKSKIDPI